MPRGGARPNSGRRKGDNSRATRLRRMRLEKAAGLIEKKIAQKTENERPVVPFKGDAHEYLVSIYKDPTIPMPFRVDAAKASIPYEKPRLAAITVTPSHELPPVVEGITYEIVDPMAEMTAEQVEQELESQMTAEDYAQLEHMNSDEYSAAEFSPETRAREPAHSLETTSTEEARPSGPFLGIL
jgi:hypothetical protein